MKYTQTIDPDLIEQYKIVHKQNYNFGTSGNRIVDRCKQVLDGMKVTSIFDYGCGKSTLGQALLSKPDDVLIKYDPAIPEFSERYPGCKCDLVLCTDVLEHIREETVPAVIADIATISDKALFIIATRKAIQILPTGENAHCTIKPAAWWLDQIKVNFKRATIFHNIPKHSVIIKTW